MHKLNFLEKTYAKKGILYFNTQRMYTVSELIEEWDIKRYIIQQAINAGELPAVFDKIQVARNRVAKGYYVLGSDFLAFLNKTNDTPSPELNKPKKQSRKNSLFEQLVSTVIGFVVSIILVKLFFKDITLFKNIYVTLTFTAASVVRGYFVRRVFNK